VIAVTLALALGRWARSSGGQSFHPGPRRSQGIKRLVAFDERPVLFDLLSTELDSQRTRLRSGSDNLRGPTVGSGQVAFAVATFLTTLDQMINLLRGLASGGYHNLVQLGSADLP